MRELIYITILLTSTLCFGQNIVQEEKYNGVNTRLEKGFIEPIIQNIITGKVQYVTPPLRWRIENFNKIKVVDTTKHTTGRDYLNQDSTAFFYLEPRKLKRERGFGFENLNFLDTIFTLNRFEILDISDNSFRVRAYLTQQCEVVSIYANGLEVFTASGFNASQIGAEYRHTRTVSQLQPNTRYAVVVDYKNRYGEILRLELEAQTTQ